MEAQKTGSKARQAGCTRRGFLRTSAGLTLGLAGMTASRAWAAEAAEVQAPAGKFAGTVESGVRRFVGLPFAQAPVGRLRFRAPEPLAPLSAPWNATRFRAAAMQKPVEGVELSEDCLYLNVWTPVEPGPHPVLVWIHGGGFLGGRAAEATYDGTGFARQGVVVVTVTYRLGAFGFLDLGPILGSTYAGSANNGVRDLIAALGWVHSNIEAFGGNPERVTVAGQSAGGKLTDLLLSTQAARPYFQQAASESGGADRAFPKERSLEFAAAFGDFFAAESRGAKTALLTAAASDVIALQSKFLEKWPVHFPFRSQADGDLIPLTPLEGIRREFHGKRLLIGTNREESAFFLGPSPADDTSEFNLGNLSLEHFNKIYAQYPQVYPEMTTAARRIRAVTAEEYWIPSVRVAEAAVAAGGRVWMYRYDYPHQAGRFKGQAIHAAETHLVWNRPEMTGPEATGEQKMAEQMHGAWLGFIRKGAPAVPAAPAWPTYELAERKTMALNLESHVERDPQAAERRLWDGLLLRTEDR